jgi:ABC-type branched-subunit amino acid transport system ATPase component
MYAGPDSGRDRRDHLRSLETGRVTLVGESATLLADPRVQHAYLGA